MYFFLGGVVLGRPTSVVLVAFPKWCVLSALALLGDVDLHDEAAGFAVLAGQFPLHVVVFLWEEVKSPRWPRVMEVKLWFRLPFTTYRRVRLLDGQIVGVRLPSAGHRGTLGRLAGCRVHANEGQIKVWLSPGHIGSQLVCGKL